MRLTAIPTSIDYRKNISVAGEFIELIPHRNAASTAGPVANDKPLVVALRRLVIQTFKPCGNTFGGEDSWKPTTELHRPTTIAGRTAGLAC